MENIDKDRKITLIIRTEEIDTINLSEVKENFPLPHSKYTNKDSPSYKRTRKEILAYEKRFSKKENLSKQITQFVKNIIPHKNGLTKLKTLGYSWDLSVSLRNSNVTQKVVLDKEMFEVLKTFDEKFWLVCSTVEGLKKKEIQNIKKLALYEKEFLKATYSSNISSTKMIYLNKSKTIKYQFDFKYYTDEEKLLGFEYFFNQLITQKNSGLIKPSGSVRIYSYNAWWDEWLLINPDISEKIVNLDIDIELNWYSGGWVKE